MNTRMRVRAIPVLLASSLGISMFGGPAKILAKSLQPTGYDEITLKVEEDGVTGMPESVAAGRYLVKVSGPEPGEMGPSGFIIMQPPDGMTPEDIYESVQAAKDGPPEWYLDAHWGGGFTLAQGTEGWAILDFTPGAWMVTTPFGTTLPVAFEVTGEFPTDVAAPDANVAMDAFEMDFKVTSGAFVAGDNIVTFHNSGTQLHFVDVMKVPDGTTEEQVEGLFNFFMTGTPEPGSLQEADGVPVFTSADMSPDVSQTIPVTMEAGSYLFSCWVPDPTTGMPHAMMGMHELITIAE